MQIFLYITSKNKVAGCLVAERIEQAFPVIINEHNNPEPNDNDTDTDTESTKDNSTTIKSETEDNNETTNNSEKDSVPPTSPTNKNLKQSTISTANNKISLQISDKNSTKNKNKIGMWLTSIVISHAILDEEKRFFSVCCSKEPQKAVLGVSRVSIRKGKRNDE